ncbi:MAG TPA: hypothetical protein VKU38_20880 [Ktedonobacteraceae bacterium]|nr:hypothetical protein [Ktedonobacteraceae bacterium]
MCNNIHLQEKLLEEHRHTMQREMAQQRLLTRSTVPHPGLGRHIVGTLGTRLIAIGMRLEQIAL